MVNPAKIRIGDVVEVIAPVRFLRCGYDLTLNDLTEKIYQERNKEIFDFVVKMTSNRRGIISRAGVVKTKTTKTSTYMVARAIAYEIINDQIRTGNKRRLFLEPFNKSYDYWPSATKGSRASVIAVKHVKTGIFVKGEWDFESACLKDEKTFKILKLEFEKGYKDEWMLAQHVRKVYDK